MEFLFQCSTWYLTRYLTSEVSSVSTRWRRTNAQNVGFETLFVYSQFIIPNHPLNSRYRRFFFSTTVGSRWIVIEKLEIICSVLIPSQLNAKTSRSCLNAFNGENTSGFDVPGGGWWWIQELCDVSNQKIAPFTVGPRTTKVLRLISKNFSPSVDVKVDHHQFVWTTMCTRFWNKPQSSVSWEERS